ncbi:hypothetical protein [Floccifex sp.]|uniref:hypothetical protein n=1 Tax=Floccifex sp. TaxID=2815810 RepID=UPI003EFE0739
MKKIIFPNIWIVLCIVPVSTILLIYTFSIGEKESLPAYISYICSAYSLIIVCARISTISISNLKNKIHQNKIIHRYLIDTSFQVHISLLSSTCINFVFAILKLIYGIKDQSIWFGTLAVYYITLTTMRCILLWHVNKNEIGSNLKLEYKQYRNCGIILLLMNIALSGIVILMIRKNESFQYPGYLIYVVALYAFYNVITAIKNVIQYRKYKSPVLSAAKIINLVSALVSMLSLETAMIMQFGQQRNSEFRRMMTSLTGSTICVLVLVIAIYMIFHGTNKRRRIND